MSQLTKQLTGEERTRLNAKRFTCAVEWLTNYPVFERQRLMLKQQKLDTQLREALAKTSDFSKGARIVEVFENHRKMVDRIMDDKLYYSQLAMQAVRLYDSLPTEELLDSIEQYIEKLSEDY